VGRAPIFIFGAVVNAVTVEVDLIDACGLAGVDLLKCGLAIF